MFTHTVAQRLPYADALLAYRQLRAAFAKGLSFILESRSVHETYGRFSLVGADPVLSLEGRQADVLLQAYHPAGMAVLQFVREAFATYVAESSDNTLRLNIPQGPAPLDEADRFTRMCGGQVVRQVLKAFAANGRSFCGLYGALGYNFVAQFEDLPPLPADGTTDFRLALYDCVLLYNHLTQETTLYATAASDAAAESRADSIRAALANDPAPLAAPLVSQVQVSPSASDYQAQVRQAVRLCETGELLELVLARELTARIAGDALTLYARYRERNPAPYLFYYDFGDEQLCGASPEMLVRVESGRATLRPISGSAPRGANAVEDHQRMLALLNSGKEKSELDMLIDLGRNDLARVCQPGVRVDDYRVVEKYSAVMHTVAQVSGELQRDCSGFDALVACLNAGTLTGAPKLAAMRYIAEIEARPRGYYGGAVGYLLLNGEVNTGITIRTAHIRDGHLSYTAGATLLVESDPEAELRETELKTAAFQAVLAEFQLQPADVHA